MAWVPGHDGLTSEWQEQTPEDAVTVPPVPPVDPFPSDWVTQTPESGTMTQREWEATLRAEDYANKAHQDRVYIEGVKTEFDNDIADFDTKYANFIIVSEAVFLTKEQIDIIKSNMDAMLVEMQGLADSAATSAQAAIDAAAAAQTFDPANYVPVTRQINGKSLSANITLNKGDVGLGNVDNTADADKPVSTAQATAINARVPNTRKVNNKALSADITLDKTDIGLGNVDNTSDANKPVSTAQAAADALRLLLTGGTMTGAIAHKLPGDTVQRILRVLKDADGSDLFGEVIEADDTLSWYKYRGGTGRFLNVNGDVVSFDKRPVFNGNTPYDSGNLQAAVENIVKWKRVVYVPTGPIGLNIIIPSTAKFVRFSGAVKPAGGFIAGGTNYLFGRVSYDNGATFVSTGTYSYEYKYRTNATSSMVAGFQTDTGWQMSGNMETTSLRIIFNMDFWPGGLSGGSNTIPQYKCHGNGYANNGPQVGTFDIDYSGYAGSPQRTTNLSLSCAGGWGMDVGSIIVMEYVE